MLLAQVQTYMAAKVNESTQVSGTATAAMSIVSTFATPNAGGPLGEVARHGRDNAQTMEGV